AGDAGDGRQPRRNPALPERYRESERNGGMGNDGRHLTTSSCRVSRHGAAPFLEPQSRFRFSGRGLDFRAGPTDIGGVPDFGPVRFKFLGPGLRDLQQGLWAARPGPEKYEKTRSQASDRLDLKTGYA